MDKKEEEKNMLPAIIQGKQVHRMVEGPHAKNKNNCDHNDQNNYTLMVDETRRIKKET